MADALDKIVRARVILIEGDEGAIRAERLQDILTRVEVSIDDFDLEQINADERPLAEWISSVCTIPFLAPRRVLIVRHAGRVTPDAPSKGANLNLAKKTLTTLPTSAMLILVADEEQGDDDKQRKIGTVTKAWRDRIKAEGGEVVLCKTDGNEVAAKLKQYFQVQGVGITPTALSTLVEMCGENYSRALSEAEKLVLSVPEKGQVNENLVTDLVVASREWNVFKMIDGIVGNQPAQALRQLKTLMGNSQKPDDQVFRTILPMVSRQLRLLWQARACRDASVRMEDIPSELEGWFPDRPNFAKEQSYRQRDLLRLADKVTLPRLAKALRVLSDTDGRLKGMGASVSTTDTVERMVVEMVAALHPPVVVKP